MIHRAGPAADERYIVPNVERQRVKVRVIEVHRFRELVTGCDVAFDVVRLGREELVILRGICVPCIGPWAGMLWDCILGEDGVLTNWKVTQRGVN